MVKRSFRIARRLVTDPAGSGRELVRRLTHNSTRGVGPTNQGAAPAQQQSPQAVPKEHLASSPVDAAPAQPSYEATAYTLRSQLNRAESRMNTIMQNVASGRLQGTTNPTAALVYGLKTSEARLLGKLREQHTAVGELRETFAATLAARLREHEAAAAQRILAAENASAAAKASFEAQISAAEEKSATTLRTRMELHEASAAARILAAETAAAEIKASFDAQIGEAHHKSAATLRVRMEEHEASATVRILAAETAAAEIKASFDAQIGTLTERSASALTARLQEHENAAAQRDAAFEIRMREQDAAGAERARIAEEQFRQQLVLADSRAIAAEKVTADVRTAFEAQIVALRAEHIASLQRLNLDLESERVRNDHIATNFLAMKSQLTAEIRGFRLEHGTSSDHTAVLYLDIMEKVLTGEASADPPGDPWSPSKFDPMRRHIGRDWPESAVTMIGSSRMRNVRLMCEKVLAERVPGDFIETGVWRGGACIYMRAILKAAGDTSRRVFVADSFKGLPPPDAASFPADTGDTHYTYEKLAVSAADVEANFRRFDLMDERVIFLEGWFKDTLPKAPIEKLAVLRLDGDMYESTTQALHALYDKVSPGGIVIVDDYVLPPCAKAIDDFRAERGITAPLVDVDGAAVWWQVDKTR